MTEFEFSSSVWSIGESAFYGCSSLEKIIIHALIKNVEANAFNGCTAIKEIECPSSIDRKVVELNLGIKIA